MSQNMPFKEFVIACIDQAMPGQDKSVMIASVDNIVQGAKDLSRTTLMSLEEAARRIIDIAVTPKPTVFHPGTWIDPANFRRHLIKADAEMRALQAALVKNKKRLQWIRKVPSVLNRIMEIRSEIPEKTLIPTTHERFEIRTADDIGAVRVRGTEALSATPPSGIGTTCAESSGS